MSIVISICLTILIAMIFIVAAVGSVQSAWRGIYCQRGTFAALAALAVVATICAQKPSPDTPTITVDALLRDVGCYATNNVFHAAVTNAPSYAGVDFSDCDLMVYARERASSDAASWFELTPRKKFSQQPADYAIENATNFNYMVYLNYVPPTPVHTNGVFELYGFVIENEAQGEPDQLAAGFINSRAVPLPFDAEVEYLQSTGTQYIDTGARLEYPKIHTGVWYDRYRVQYTRFFGYYSSEAHNSIRLILQSSANDRGWGSAASKAGGSINVPLAANAWHDVFLDCTLRSCTIDGAAFTSANVGTRYVNNIYIFADNRGPTPNAVIRIAFFRIWDESGNLVFDGKPVRKDGVGYMYDQVSGQLFGNAGTGAFIVGPDK